MADTRQRSITRRGLIRAGAATAVAGAAIGLVSGCKHADEDAAQPVVVNETASVNVTDTYEEVQETLTELGRWTVPVGTVLRSATSSTWVPAISAGASASPIVKASVFSLSSGELSTVVGTHHLSESPNVIVYDVRCSDSIYAWVEIDALERTWGLYAAGFANGGLTGGTTTLWTGDADWDPPRFAVAGSRVIWQVMPSLSGSKTSEYSYCYLWHLGDKKAQAVVESQGRFAMPPSVSENTLTLAPRVLTESGSTYYGITCYRLDDDLSSIVDQLVLPQSVRPFRATRMGDVFAFSVEANYNSGGLLGQMGTYIGTGDGPFVTLIREPSAEVAGKGSRYLVKSRSSYFVLDTKKESFSILGAVNRAVDYGEYPASDGSCDTFVTFSTVKNATTGYPEAVVVRSFDLQSSPKTGQQDSSDQDGSIDT